MSIERPFILGITMILAACGGNTFLENSTARISIGTINDARAGLDLRLMHNEEFCRTYLMGSTGEYDENEFDSYDEQLNACVPNFNRHTGEISLSFALYPPDASNPLRLPIDGADVSLNHSGWKSSDANGEGGFYRKEFSASSAAQKDGQKEIAVSFEPHDPVNAGQLFVVLVDHSGSMQEKATDPTTGETKSRMDWVKEALMEAKGVFVKSAKKDSEGNQVVPPSVVALLRFGGGQGHGRPPGKKSMKLEGMKGESWQSVKPIVSGQDYDRQVALLGEPLGWTHLYNAVDVAVGDLLQGKTYLASFLRSQKHLMPTIIVLTDGFNNTFYSQKCKDNTAQLSELLGSIEEARGRKGSLSQRPTVYTVGFGKPLPIPEIVQSSTTVDPLDLCGSQGEERISTGGRGIALERDYIDGGSLRLIADFGGGKSYVDPNPAKLKEAFLSAAPPRYRWYTYKYRMKSTELRSPFVTEIVLNRFAAASAKVKWYPSSWIDGPASTARYDKKKGSEGVTWVPTGWSRPSSVRHASGLLLLLLGILMTLSFLGPALFNGRRAVTRRSRKTS